MIRLIFKNVGKYWWAAVLAPLFMVGEVAMDMLITKQMQRLIDEGIQAANPEAV